MSINATSSPSQRLVLLAPLHGDRRLRISRTESLRIRSGRRFTLAAALILASSTPADAVCDLIATVFADGFEGGTVCGWPHSIGGSACTDYTIDFCRLQFPTSIEAVEGTFVSVSGRVAIAGLTDQNTGNDPAAQVSGFVGYGPEGSDPSFVDSCWVWTPASPNGAYDVGSPGWELGNDEYQALLTVPSPEGFYDFAYRFSGDSGETFTYCDAGSGSANGYSQADAGQLTSLPSTP